MRCIYISPTTHNKPKCVSRSSMLRMVCESTRGKGGGRRTDLEVEAPWLFGVFEFGLGALFKEGIQLPEARQVLAYQDSNNALRVRRP